MRIGLYFGGFGEKLNYFLGFWEQRQIAFRELRNFLSVIRGDQYIISMEQGSTDPLGASYAVVGKQELFFSEVVPLGFTKLYLLFV